MFVFLFKVDLLNFVDVSDFIIHFLFKAGFHMSGKSRTIGDFTVS